ncbi:MAG: hypothetical protein NTW26_01630 [bacterium]|nr:hypothetical protein [bacterium]
MAAEKAKNGEAVLEMIILKKRMHWSERGFSILFSWVMIVLVVVGGFFTSRIIDLFESQGVYLDLSTWVFWILVIPFIANIYVTRLSQPFYAVTDTRVVMTKSYSKDVAVALPLNEIVRAEIVSKRGGSGNVNIYTNVNSGNRLLITSEGEFGVASMANVAKPEIFVNTLNAARRSLSMGGE